MSRVKAIEQGNYREYTPLLHLSTGRFLSTRFRGDYTSSRHVFKPIAADRANARACTGCQLRDPRTHGTVGGEASSAYETYAASDLQDLGPCPVRDRATTAIIGNILFAYNCNGIRKALANAYYAYFETRQTVNGILERRESVKNLPLEKPSSMFVALVGGEEL
ncbi:hypothetical protein VTP01DRAFT_3439 [Rhizomucor pusillus]|uniref:uncharacterized protein n=1 Tax=Rhizomucor pusillus TaxID=4840 RepID=UPI0037424085